METPVTSLCPLKGCEARIILSHVNDVSKLRRHLLMAHRGCKVAHSLWRRWDAMNASKLDEMDDIEVDITKIRNPAELKPVIPEDGKHYLVKWLEKFLQRGELKSTDLFYQEIYAQFTVHLCSSEQIRWDKFPTLNEYCSALRNTVDQKAYNLFLGKHNVGSKSERPSFSNVNHPGPNVRALYRKKGTPNYDGGIAWDVVTAFTLLLENCKDSVFYKDEKQKFKWYPCVVGYDEQPLNKGKFIRALGNDLYLDGIKPTMSFTEIMQLKEKGIDIVNHIQKNCKYISEVKEFFVTDVGGNVSLNFATFFCVGAYDANVVVLELNSVIGQMSRCLNCITSGSECHNENGCCLLCASENKECVYLRAIHCYADMLPAQRMAHELLNGQQALSPFSRMTGQYTLFTFGFLHVCKALVGYIRNWYITNNKDCFNVAMICGLLSNAKFDMMSSQIDPRTLNYRDRHSDVVAYNTVGPQVQALLQSAKSVTVTLVPDLYRPWTLESKSHKELLKQPQPCYVAVNAKGEVFWSDRINHVISMGNRHNPMKIQVFGSYGVQGKTKEGVLAQKALFCGPEGVAVGVDGKNEVLIVADTGNNCLKLITGCRSFRTKKVVYTLTGTVEPFVPLAVHFVEGKNLLMVSNIATGHISIGKVNWSQHTFSAVKNVGGMSGATGLCFHIGLGAMLVAKGKELIIYDMENENLQSQRWTDSRVECVGDVAVDSTGRVAVSDSDKNVVHILQEASKRLQFCESLGSGSCNGQDGQTQFASFEEPIGLCFYGRSMYICCHRSGLKLTSPTDFAVAYCEKVRNMYICAGFRPRGEDISSKDYQQSIQEIARCSTFFSNVNELRRSNLESENVSTQEGALYQQTVNCLKTSACMLNSQLSTFAVQTNWFMNKGLCVRAFTNEAVVEHGFGFSQQQSQYTALSMEQYARNKVDNCSTNIWKLCKNNFSYHLSENKQYQAPHSLSVKATDIFDMMKKVRKQVVDVDKDYKEPVKSDKLDKLKVINRILKPQACQNTRAKYKAHCGSAPCTTTIVDRREIRGPSFSDKNKLSVKNTTVSSEEAGDNGIVAGDILAVLGEQENDKNEWWLLQANRSLPTSKWKRNCEVTGYWLEQQDIDICQEDSVTYCLDDRNEVKVRYRNLIKGKDGDPYLVPQECFCSGWKNSQTLFTFSKQLCDELDSLLELALILEVDSEDNIESESITEEANNYCQDLGTSARQRSISSRGRMYKSYKDMLSTH